MCRYRCKDVLYVQIHDSDSGYVYGAPLERVKARNAYRKRYKQNRV